MGIGTDPNALTTYLPFYLGKYDPAGNLLDGEGNKDKDPFLYWLLPTMPEMIDPTVPRDPERMDVVSVYAILHAYGSEEAVEQSGAKWKFRVQPGGRATNFR
jgi:hypothetical protein